MKSVETYQEDRRRVKRVPGTHIVWYKIIPGNGDGRTDKIEGICKSFDISTNGIGLYLTAPLPVGESIFLEIIFNNTTISAYGNVVHSFEIGEGMHRAGIQFEIVPPNDTLALSEVLTGT